MNGVLNQTHKLAVLALTMFYMSYQFGIVRDYK